MRWAKVTIILTSVNKSGGVNEYFLNLLCPSNTLIHYCACVFFTFHCPANLTFMHTNILNTSQQCSKRCWQFFFSFICESFKDLQKLSQYFLHPVLQNTQGAERNKRLYLMLCLCVAYEIAMHLLCCVRSYNATILYISTRDISLACPTNCNSQNIQKSERKRNIIRIKLCIPSHSITRQLCP